MNTLASKKSELSKEELQRIHAYWRVANYLSVGQIYLHDNPLLKKPLTFEHIKSRQLGQWGETPGLNVLYVHLNRIIKKHDCSILYSRSRAWRSQFAAQHLFRGNLQRGVSKYLSGY